MFCTSKHRRIVIATAGLAWLGIVVTGTVLMLAYSNAPGEAGSPPAQWPGASKIPRDQQHPTLIMYIHPHCSCSKASVGELALLMAHCQGRVNAHVLILQPAEMPANWCQTDLWRDAARVPGVTVERDDGGHEARLFQIETSGDSVLYDADGNLRFHGGITISRSHSGDNPGRDALQNLIFGNPAQETNAAAFGCSLFECKLKDNQ